MKKSFFRAIILIVVMVVLISISGSVFVLAQEQNGVGGETNRPVSVLPAKVPSQVLQASGSPVGGAGYVGPGSEVAQPGTALSDKSPAINSSTGSAHAVQPSGPGQDVVLSGTISTTWKWYTMAGAVFIPWSNIMTWSYGGAGCLQPTTTGFWRASFNIPDGSLLEEMYFGFYNSASSAASTAYLYAYSYNGAVTPIATINSVPGSTFTGYDYEAALISDVKVDNLTNAYAFTWSGSTSQQLCYIQVGYIPTNAFGVALPLIMKNP